MVLSMKQPMYLLVALIAAVAMVVPLMAQADICLDPECYNVALQENMLITSPDHDSVYLYKDGVRRPFINDRLFRTWYENFDDVLTLETATVEAIQLGSPMPPKSGEMLLKFPFNPHVYHVTDEGHLRHIASADVARGIYGEKWESLIMEMPEEYSLFFHKLAEIDQVEPTTFAVNIPHHFTLKDVSLKINVNYTDGLEPTVLYDSNRPNPFSVRGAGSREPLPSDFEVERRMGLSDSIDDISATVTIANEIGERENVTVRAPFNENGRVVFDITQDDISIPVVIVD